MLVGKLFTIIPILLILPSRAISYSADALSRGVLSANERRIMPHKYAVCRPGLFVADANVKSLCRCA